MTINAIGPCKSPALGSRPLETQCQITLKRQHKFLIHLSLHHYYAKDFPHTKQRLLDLHSL